METANGSCATLNYSAVFVKCCEKKLWPPRDSAEWSSVFAGVAFSTTAFIGVILNTFTLVALCTSKALLKKPATSFVLNLALADLIFCIVVLPVDAVTFITGYTWSSANNSPMDGLPEAICFFSGLTKHAAPTIDWTTLALIGLERYCKIVAGDDVHRKFFRKKCKRLIIACLWIISWTFFGVFASYGFSKKTMRCTLKAATQKWHFIRGGQFSMAWVLLIIIIIIFTCLRIWRRVRESAATLATFSRRSGAINKIDAPTDSSSANSFCKTQDVSETTPAPGSDNESPTPALTGATGEAKDGHSVDDCDTMAIPCPPPRSAVTSPGVSFMRKTSDSVRTLKSSFLSIRNNRGEYTPGSGGVRERYEVTGVRLKTVLVKRDLSLVKMIAVTTGTYIFLVTPMAILNVVDNCGQEPDIRNILYSLYVWLHVINFFVYVRTNPAYRQSFLKLIKKMCPWCCV